jgi:hypothetical protein
MHCSNWLRFADRAEVLKDGVAKHTVEPREPEATLGVSSSGAAGSVGSANRE